MFDLGHASAPIISSSRKRSNDFSCSVAKINATVKHECCKSVL
jgi:hypothetical protein